jgi:4-cresol dehydrogenase (hydroxylating)
MQIVLADGRLLETGFGHFPNAKAHRVYRYGVGPMLDGLFCQSNLGIVTRIGLWLMPRPEAFCAFFFSAPNDDQLADLIDRLQPLRLQGLLQSAVHIGNDLRVFSSRTRYPWGRAAGKTPLPESIRNELRHRYGVGAWNGLGAIYGTQRTVQATREAVYQALKPYRIRFLGDRGMKCLQILQKTLSCIGLGRKLGEIIKMVRPPYDLLKGVPSDEALAGAGWRVHDQGPPQPLDPLQTNTGLIWVSPVLPSRGAMAVEILAIIEPVYRKHQFEPLVTFTMITERAMICVTNISYDQRQPDEAAKARACYEELMNTLIPAGYIPYRTGLQGYEKLSSHPSVFWDVARQIKHQLDPKGIISPGRYIRD